MKKHISFPSIEQYRNVVYSINRQSTFEGIGGDGEPIYNPTKVKPTLTFTGTVKLHGTNAGVAYNVVEGIWYQSRENIITPEKDNAGFAFFADNNRNKFLEFFQILSDKNNLDLSQNTLTIYGEWCGGNIQKGVGISNLEKTFFIFGVKVSPFDETIPAYWIDYRDLKSPTNKIYNISDFQQYLIQIDFNYPELSQNKLANITEIVEKECPVAKAFGFEGIGEGVVWTCYYQNVVYRFKVKGEKHQPSKVKTLASVDTDKITSIREFIEYSVTDNRFNQALGIIFPDGVLDVKKTGDLIRWVINDIIKEESDTLANNGLEPKDINKYISEKVKTLFISKI